MKLKLVLAALSLVCMAQYAAAHDATAIWYGVITPHCMLQDAKYASLPTGQVFAQTPNIQEWMESHPSSVKACFQTKKPIPDGLCTELLSQQPNRSDDRKLLGALQKSYPDALEKLAESGCVKLR